MMKSHPCCSQFNQIVSQSLLVGTLTVAGFLSGIVPGLARNTYTLVFDTSVYAQATNVSSQDIKTYAQAVIAIERLRQAAYQEIKNILNSKDVPEIVCNNPGSINGLPPQARGVAQNYCNQSSGIVANYFPKGKNARFNEITAQMQSNPNLRKLVQEELLRLQQ